MNTGRNWTRRSIEELIDDFLRRQKAPTSSLQYTLIQGNDGDSFVNLGISGRTTPKPFFPELVNTTNPVQNDVREVCVELTYRDTRNLEYKANNTYFPITAVRVNTKFELPYVYVIPIDQNTPTVVYTNTCYKLTRTSPTLALPCISNYEGTNSRFTANVSPTSIHSIPTSQIMLMFPLAFFHGTSDVNFTAMRDLNATIRNNILTPLNKTMATVLLSSVVISDGNIQASTGVTNFQSLTY